MLVFLNDKKTGAIQNIGENSTYSFTAAEGDDPARFELIFGTVGVNESNLPVDLMCYALRKTIYLKSASPISGEVVISSLTGKQLLRMNATG